MRSRRTVILSYDNQPDRDTAQVGQRAGPAILIPSKTHDELFGRSFLQEASGPTLRLVFTAAWLFVATVITAALTWFPGTALSRYAELITLGAVITAAAAVVVCIF